MAKEKYEFKATVQISESRMFKAEVIRRTAKYGGDLVFEIRQFFRRQGGGWEFSKNGVSLSLTKTGIVGTPDGEVEFLEAELVLEMVLQFLAVLQGGGEDA